MKNKTAKKSKEGQQATAQGLAVLKTLIAKAAAGTLVTKKAPETAAQSGDPPPEQKEQKVEVPPELPPKPITASIKVAMEVQTEPEDKKEVVTAPKEENDYWTEEKLKMQKDPAYQSFKKGLVKKNSTSSKGTSPPPQTISTQVNPKS